MRGTKIFVKQKHGVLVRECDALTLRRGYGIDGDTTAQAGSPFQVLIASANVLGEGDRLTPVSSTHPHTRSPNARLPRQLFNSPLVQSAVRRETINRKAVHRVVLELA